MNSVERYVGSVEQALQVVESGDASKLLQKVISEASNNALAFSNSESIRKLELMLKRIVSARKELALQANGLKPLLQTLKNIRSKNAGR